MAVPYPSAGPVAPLTESLPAALSEADRARVDAALRDSRAANTRAQYRSAWKAWAEWSALNGHATLPAARGACVAGGHHERHHRDHHQRRSVAPR